MEMMNQQQAMLEVWVNMTKSKFIVVKHDAKKARLHYDLRFVMPNSKNWMSFAVRKGVPEKPGAKVLAVRTHDHSDQEALFLGTIPDGEYGAGKLTKYDDGSCEIKKFKPGHIIIDFKGRKIKGVYHLINIGKFNKRDYKKQQYILFKGTTLNEWAGLAHTLPPDQYEDQDDVSIDGEKLSWSYKKTIVKNNTQVYEQNLRKPQRITALEQIYDILKRI